MKNKKRYILIIFLLFILLNKRVSAEKLPNLTRLEGKNRIETSIAISKEAYETSKTVILVGYNGEVDALTGTILAEKKGAPILISDKKNLSQALKDEFKRLECSQVFILGGSTVVDRQIEKDIKALGLSVKRINGKNREETALDIAEEAIEGSVDSAFLSLGYGVYADALAIGPVAANKNSPLLLTKTKELGKTTLDYIVSKGIQKINIIGGESAVSLEVEKSLKARGIETKRIRGNNREETAISIAESFIDNPQKLVLANGYKYADAVAGGYLAAKENAPILLSRDNILKDVNEAYIGKKKIDTIVLGGKTVITSSVFEHMKSALGIKKANLPLPSIPKNFTELKSKMKTEFETFKAEISLEYDGKITLDDLSFLIKDIYSDGSYISGTLGRVTSQVVDCGEYTQVNFSVEYRNTLEEEEFINSEVNRILKNIIKPGMSEFEKVKAVHDYIINNTRYAKDTKHSPHSAYTIFKEGKGVCQAYTLASYRLLDAIGIENYYVVGKSSNGGVWNDHSWNLLKIDGRYYNMDVTKDDPLISDGEQRLTYKNFLVSDKEFSKTHRPQRNIFPKALDSKYEVLKGAEDPFEYKGILYFGNKDDEEKLYSLSLKNLQLRKMSNERAPYVVVSNDKIYYSNYSQGGYIYRADLDGKNPIRMNTVHSTNLKLQYPKIVFLNKSTNRWSSIDISR